MNSPRFYCATPLSAAGDMSELELPSSAARHIAQALRMRVGDAVTLFNGEGGEFAATIARIDRRGVAVHIGAFNPLERETSHPTTLVQSVIAADMMDLVVRKAVELGAGRIVPVFAEYSQRTPEARTAKRVERWRQIAISACEQCGRNRVPAIEDVAPLSSWLDSDGRGTGVVMLAPEAPIVYGEFLRKAVPRSIVIGPEGGFTRQECDQAQRNGATLARLGRAWLRSETAALAALAAIVAQDFASRTT